MAPDTGRPIGQPAKSARWSDLRRRALSAALLAPVVLVCIWFGSVAFALLMLVGAVGLSVEWAGLCRVSPAAWPGVVLPALVVAATVLTPLGLPAVAVAVLVVGSALLWAVSKRGLLAAGVLYVGLPIVAILWLRDGTAGHGREAMFLLVLVVWASDIGAYAAGRLFRGPLLAPGLSPAKTWSGAAGGLVLAIVVGQVVLLASSGHPGAVSAIVAGLLAVACQAGDLLESGIKRHVGVKDSGRLIPGHGGMLDRLDGLLAAAPVAAIVMLASRGEWLWR